MYWGNNNNKKLKKKYYSSLKEDTLTFATTWIKLENIMLSEIRDTTERKKNA